VGLAWVVATQPLHHAENLLLQAFGYSTLKQGNHFFFIRLYTGRKPERSTGKAINVIGSSLLKCFTRIRSDKVRKVRKVLVWIWITPTHKRVCAKCNYQHSNSLMCNGMGSRLYRYSRHIFTPAKVKSAEMDFPLRYPNTQCGENYAHCMYLASIITY
jgi:hypothetical protein